MHLRFSVLSYYPSFLTTDCISVGILFEDNTGYKFEATKNFKRLAAFDDELAVEFVRLYLAGIKEEVESSTVFTLEKPFNMERYVGRYVNEFKFGKIQSIETDNIDNEVEYTKRIFLRYDYDKGQRPNENDQRKYFHRLLVSNNINYTKEVVEGIHNDKINFDFIIGDYGIKFFILDKKNLNKIISTAKAWAFNADELNGKIKTLFIYDIENSNDAAFDTILRILSKNSYKVLNIKDGINFINEFSNNVI